MQKEKYLNRIKIRYTYYDFSKFEYINSTNKSIVICKEHGEFLCSYKELIRSGSGILCKKCRNGRNIINNEKEALKLLENKYPDLDFSKFEYTGYKCNSIVICPIHGEFVANFESLYCTHMYGCKKCKKDNYRNILKLDKEEAINNLKNKFPNLDFNKFIYNDSRTKSIVICKEHGEFLSSYSKLMNRNTKYGCSYCSKNKVMNPMDFLINKFPNLDFTDFEYINYTNKSKYRCKIHNIELQNTYARLKDSRNKYGCHLCRNNGKSTYETEIIKYIKTFYNKDIEQSNRNIIKNIHSGYYLELDIYLPDIKLAIEFNGKYYHTDNFIKQRTNNIFSNANEYHKYKTDECNRLGIRLIHINESDYIDNKESILYEIKKEIEL